VRPFPFVNLHRQATVSARDAEVPLIPGGTQPPLGPRGVKGGKRRPGHACYLRFIAPREQSSVWPSQLGTAGLCFAQPPRFDAWFSTSGTDYEFGELRFADGTVWTPANVKALLNGAP
jgi:hypothetical protein